MNENSHSKQSACPCGPSPSVRCYCMPLADDQADLLTGHGCCELARAAPHADPDRWRRSIHPDDRPYVLQALEHSRRTGELFRTEYRMMDPVAGVRWVRDEAAIFRDEEDRPLVLHGTLLDISDLKTAQQALSDREERFRAVFQTAQDAIFIKDGSRRYVQVNPAMQRLFGRAESWFIGKHDADIFTPDECILIGRMDRTVLDGEPVDMKHTCRVGGIERTFHVIKVPMRDNSGDIIGLCGIAREVSGYEAAEEQIRRLSRFQESVIEDANVWIEVLDEQGRVVLWNRAAEQVTGYGREEVVGHDRAWEWLFPDPDYRRRIRQTAMSLMARGGSLEDYETVVHTREGETRTVSWNVRGLLDHGGRPWRAIALGRDITQRKKAEQELSASREELRQLYQHLQSVREEERSRMAREIHDELGHSLAALKMGLSWLDGRLHTAEPAAAERLQQMLQLTDDTIHTVQRISSELRPPLLDHLGLAAAIEWQAEEFESRSGIRCELNLDRELQVTDGLLAIALFRIFQETLTNVARHAGADRVEVCLRQAAGDIELVVRDNGRGIRDQEIAGHDALGLIGIRERVSGLGGEVRITGVPGEGTTVKVTVPHPEGEL